MDSRTTRVRTAQVPGYAGFPINDTTALYMYFLFLVLFPVTFSLDHFTATVQYIIHNLQFLYRSLTILA